MDDHAAADGVGGVAFQQADAGGLKVDQGHAIGVGLERGHVACVGFTVAVHAVRFGGGVEMTAGVHAVAAGAVAFFVDMKTVLAVGTQAFNFSAHRHRVTFLHQLQRAAGCVAFGGFHLHGGAEAIYVPRIRAKGEYDGQGEYVFHRRLLLRDD